MKGYFREESSFKEEIELLASANQGTGFMRSPNSDLVVQDLQGANETLAYHHQTPPEAGYAGRQVVCRGTD